jgi:hypothetical protein
MKLSSASLRMTLYERGETKQATAKAKYRDLSAAAANAPPSVEMMCIVRGAWERTDNDNGRCFGCADDDGAPIRFVQDETL